MSDGDRYIHPRGKKVWLFGHSKADVKPRATYIFTHLKFSDIAFLPEWRFLLLARSLYPLPAGARILISDEEARTVHTIISGGHSIQILSSQMAETSESDLLSSRHIMSESYTHHSFFRHASPFVPGHI